MELCCNARENTKNRIITIGLVSLWNGFVTGDLRLQSLFDNAVSIGKYVWNNDEQAQTDAIQTVVCELLDES